MKIIFLPRYFKIIGITIVLIACTLFLVKLSSGVPLIEFIRFGSDIRIYANYAVLILGFFLISFSKEKIEDELIAHFRVRALFTTTIIHSVFFFIFTFTSLTLFLINFPAIILMASLFFFYIITFYAQKYTERIKNKNSDNFQ